MLSLGWVYGSTIKLSQNVSYSSCEHTINCLTSPWIDSLGFIFLTGAIYHYLRHQLLRKVCCQFFSKGVDELVSNMLNMWSLDTRLVSQKSTTHFIHSKSVVVESELVIRGLEYCSVVFTTV